PIAGLTALTRRACFMASCPTRDVNGRTPARLVIAAHSRRAPAPARPTPDLSAAGLEPVVEGGARRNKQKVAVALEEDAPVPRVAEIPSRRRGRVRPARHLHVRAALVVDDRRRVVRILDSDGTNTWSGGLEAEQRRGG